MRNLSSVAILLTLLLASPGPGLPACLAQDQETGTITGHVKLDGNPAQSITVIASPVVTDPAKAVESIFNASASLKATTDSEGLYRLEGVPPGKYKVAVFAPALVAADNNSASEITVAEGATDEGIDFALSPGGVITGKITDGEGHPVVVGLRH